MTQQQKKSTSPSATDGKQLTGNQAAKFAAEDARNVLAQTKPLTRARRKSDIVRHIKKLGLVLGNPNDELGKTPDGTVDRFLHARNGAEGLMDLIERGEVDEKTLQWVNKSNGMNGMICFCLVPDCSIGHFIPIRVSVDT